MGSRDFAYTGAWQRWTVPRGVKYVDVGLTGGGSGSVEGGRVSGRIAVAGGQVLMILVGARGDANTGTTGGSVAFGGGGRGGDGRDRNGGRGGGGASAIRLNSTTGSVKAVAGGAGGTSGDGGLGGMGGNLVGENGWPSTTPGTVGNATGGTQTQGGNRGTSALGVTYYGNDALDTVLITAARGGSPGLPSTYGGGGGGGGYRAGGGGQGGLLGTSPAGGGGGGSNYTGGLIGWAASQGEGGTGPGSVSISWVEAPPANQPPSPPTEVKVGGADAVDELATKVTRSVTVTAKVDDPNKGQAVRLVAQITAQQDFTSGIRTYTSAPVAQTKRARVTFLNLVQNTRYWVRLYTRDSAGRLSVNYHSINFWTNRSPVAPELVSPVENASFSQLASGVFSWKHTDPDPNSTQRAFRLRWRVAATPTTRAGVWVRHDMTTWFNQYVTNPGAFKANTFYEWEAATQDSQGAWGPWSAPRSFFVTGEALAPIAVSPSRNQAYDVSRPLTFQYRFRDPDQGDTQATADLRWRTVGTTDASWVLRPGTTLTPGPSPTWTIPAHTFQPGVNYEWQARTHDTLANATSDWSESEFFWAVATPGSLVNTASVELIVTDQGVLGLGTNRAFIYDRGGQRLRGEITPLARLNWGRKRDDISKVLLTTNGFGSDCGALLENTHTWQHEIVVFRDGKRVWEGPITRIQDSADGVEMEAWDVLGYVYRRIMRQGYNDAYRLVNGVVAGQETVVQRATQIVMNALAPDNPNVLEYVTSLNFPDDAGQSRVVPDYSKMAWEEVDDMAATAGLDYSTIGRRIMLWDTHRPLGRLPEMRSIHFSDPPVISEYGMQFSTHFGVTNNNGIWGAATRPIGPEGLIEMLASAYGETEGAATEVLTPAGIAALESTLNKQAERNIAGRYPVPMVVRVPDNSTLSPETPIGINQLVPGVWIPLRAQGLVRSVAQWQKLDVVTVEQSGDSPERVAVTMSPAPNRGEDPDADTTATEDA